MKITKIYEGKDQLSYFTEMDSQSHDLQPLGFYSPKFPADGIFFRDFAANLIYDWHNAPQIQYVIYLEGAVEIELSGGEKRVFYAGDIIMATDTTGKGHITRTIAKGRAAIVTVPQRDN